MFQVARKRFTYRFIESATTRSVLSEMKCRQKSRRTSAIEMEEHINGIHMEQDANNQQCSASVPDVGLKIWSDCSETSKYNNDHSSLSRTTSFQLPHGTNGATENTLSTQYLLGTGPQSDESDISSAGGHTPQFPDSSDSLEMFDVDNHAENRVEHDDLDIRNCFDGITPTIPNEEGCTGSNSFIENIPLYLCEPGNEFSVDVFI